MGLEIPVLYKLYGEYLTRLDQLIMVSDMAKQSLRAKQEGILSTTEATRKRKPGKNIETVYQKLKSIKSSVNKAGKTFSTFCLSFFCRQW